MEQALNKRIKAIFFDLDGTIFYHPTRDLSENVLAYTKILKEKGYQLGICTSRSVAELVNIPIQFMDLMDVIITGAGTVIKYRDEVDYVTFDPLMIKEVFSLFEKENISYRWTDTDGVGYYGSYLDAEVMYFSDYLYQMIPSQKIHTDELVTSFVFFTKDLNIKTEALNLIGDNEIVEWDNGWEITPEHMNKKHGIEKVIKHWGLDISEVMAFGDGENDVTMLKAVGFGIAMANGTKTAQAVADYVTESIENDGVSKALLKLEFI